MIGPELLSMLVCPDQRTPLTLADEALVARVNRAIQGGRLKNRAGDQVERTIEGGLLRQDGVVLYLIVDGIPIMLVDEAILLDQLEAV